MNKKLLFLVGTRQNLKITYKINSLFKKPIIKETDEWIIRNTKYIYASCKEEAIAKYCIIFFKDYHGSIKGWRDWYDTSENINLWSIDKKNIRIINQEYIILEEDSCPCNINVLKEQMSAYDFRNWWQDYHCDDITEVLNND